MSTQTSFDFFTEEHPSKPEVTAHIPGFETMKPETQQALGEMVISVWKAIDDGTLQPQRPQEASVHALAFAAIALRHGHTDKSLTPIHKNTAGQNFFDERELARYANWLLRGVRSDRPTMTPERWAEAISVVKERSLMQ